MILRENSKPPIRLLLLVPVVVAFGLALVAAPAADLGLDGGLSLAISRIPLADEFDFLAHDVHPPLFYVLLRGWIRLVGTTPLAAKSLTILGGVLGVALLLGWVRSLAGNRAALVAGAILAVSPVGLEMGETAREFAPSVPAILLFAWAYTSRSRRNDWLLFSAGAVAIWTSYFAAALLAAAALDALFRAKVRRRVLAIAGAGASIMPWLIFIIARGFLRTTASDGPRQGEVVPNPFLSQLFDTTRIIVAGRELAPGWLGPALAAVGIGLVVLLAIRRRPEPATPASLGVIWYLGTSAILTIVLALCVNSTWTREGMGTRYLVTATPLLAAIFGIVSARVARSSLQLLGMALPLFVAGALGSSVWLQRAAPPTDFWAPQTMVDYLDERVGPSDVVVFSSPEQAGYYTALSRRPVHWSLVTTSPDYLAGDVFGQAEVTLRPLLAEQRTIWTVLSHQTMGAPGTVKLIDWLSAFGYGLPQVKLTDSDIVQHVAYPAGEAPRSVSAEFEGNVILSGARYAAVIPPGAILPVELDWLTSQSQARGRTVFVHFVDDSGRKWSQHDSIPVNGRAPLTAWEPGRVVVDRRGLALPSDLPPGRYWLAVGLYDDSGRLPLVGGGDAVRLGPVVVAP